MAEQTPGPVEVFESGKEELLADAKAYVDAAVGVEEARAELRRAGGAFRSAEETAIQTVSGLLEKIHESADEETDPSDYLRAVLNTFYIKQIPDAGDQVVERLTPLRSALQEGPIPVAIIGSTLGRICFGLSAGDIIVRHVGDDEPSDFDTAAGVRLEVPLTQISTYHGGPHDEDFRWLFRESDTEPANVGVVQSLGKLTLAGTEEKVREVNVVSVDHNGTGNEAKSERDIKFSTGFTPSIVYGEAAVTELLKSLYEGRQISEFMKYPGKMNALAAAVSLGIDPELVTQLDKTELISLLENKFTEQVRFRVMMEIMHETTMRRTKRRGRTGSDMVTSPKPTITGCRKVMEYVGVEEAMVIDTARSGIESVTDDIRLDDEADKLTPEDTPEYRLLEAEAANIVSALLLQTYGIEVDESRLRSDVLHQKLLDRLEYRRSNPGKLEPRMRLP